MAANLGQLLSQTLRFEVCCRARGRPLSIRQVTRNTPPRIGREGEGSPDRARPPHRGFPLLPCATAVAGCESGRRRGDSARVYPGHRLEGCAAAHGAQGAWWWSVPHGDRSAAAEWWPRVVLRLHTYGLGALLEAGRRQPGPHLLARDLTRSHEPLGTDFAALLETLRSQWPVASTTCSRTIVRCSASSSARCSAPTSCLGRCDARRALRAS